MESQLRALFYKQLQDRKVAFNPTEPDPFDLVDLTRDVTNASRIYHKRTACVREALEGASLIVADNQALASVVQQVLPRAIVVALPFGPLYVTPVQPNPQDSPELVEGPVVGLFNHNGEMEHNNRYALKLFKALKLPLLVYGESLPGIEGEVKEDFSEFAALCDILLLPSMPGAINSTTLPLALMGSKTAILADSAPGYGSLAAATGVQLLPHDPAAWRAMVRNLLDQPLKLKTMQERNQAFAVRQNRGSYAHLAQLANQFIMPPPPVKGDCGCVKRLKPAPTQPEQDQLILAKES
jgi:hypothetical protein